MSLPAELMSTADSRLFEIQTKAKGPAGRLPLTEQMLRERPSGDIFGLTQNAGMGWDPADLTRKQFERGVWHSPHRRRTAILNDCVATGSSDGLESFRAIAAHAGQYDAERARPENTGD